jgi:hypothetical protein
MNCSAQLNVTSSTRNEQRYHCENGKLEMIRFDPEEIDKGALGTCLRDVLNKLEFGKRHHSKGLHIDLTLPGTRSKK